MIYCNLKGGLGNMMFQILTTKSFAYDKGVDCSFPNLISLLNYLNSEKTYNPNLNHSHEYLKFLTLFKNLNTYPPHKEMKLFDFPFEYRHLDLPEDDFIINGFFQSEKYFKHNRDKILEWCEISSEIKDIIEKKYSHVLSKETTSIHVRRGDYVKFSNHHFVQNIDYFKNSIEVLKDITEIFVVFSDDIEWCKQNFIGNNFFFVENEKDYIEICFMSLCKNNIISNSSFSWWPAWLNNNKNKKVVGPVNWFGPNLSHTSDKDIIPSEWIKI